MRNAVAKMVTSHHKSFLSGLEAIFPIEVYSRTVPEGWSDSPAESLSVESCMWFVGRTNTSRNDELCVRVEIYVACTLLYFLLSDLDVHVAFNWNMSVCCCLLGVSVYAIGKFCCRCR